jgi:hypothetical protein
MLLAAMPGTRRPGLRRTTDIIRLTSRDAVVQAVRDLLTMVTLVAPGVEPVRSD